MEYLFSVSLNFCDIKNDYRLGLKCTIIIIIIANTIIITITIATIIITIIFILTIIVKNSVLLYSSYNKYHELQWSISISQQK